MTHRALSVLVHGDSKAGKTTLGASVPKPMLLIDAEAAHRFLDGRKVFWDPKQYAPPVNDGTWDICVVVVREYRDMDFAYRWLQQGEHPFRSVTVDSITEIQTKFKDVLDPEGDQMKIQQWGQLLSAMEKLIRGLRDLTEHPVRPIEAVVITAMTELKDDKWRPYVQGKLQVKMPYFMDIIMYLEVQEIAHPTDPMQPPTRTRVGWTVGDARHVAGERVQGRLPERIANPRVDAMLDAIFGPAEVPATVAVQEGTPAQ